LKKGNRKNFGRRGKKRRPAKVKRRGLTISEREEEKKRGRSRGKEKRKNPLSTRKYSL